MSFCKKSKKSLIAVFIFSYIILINRAAAQNDSTQVLSDDAVETIVNDAVDMKESVKEIETGNSIINDNDFTDTTFDSQKQPDWYSLERYNLAGTFTYSLMDIKMNENLKEVGTDYSGLNHKISYLLMGTSSGWDVSNLSDLTFSSWKKRLIVDTFRLEAEKDSITINAGDFYPSYSGITLEGLTVRGLGYKNTYNKRLVIQAFIAQSQKAIEPIKEDRNDNLAIDQEEDTNGNNILDVKEGDFSQHMLAGRIENQFSGYFNAGINIISAKDNISSIPNPQSVDSTSVLYPVLKNNIIGIDGHLHYFDDMLKIDSEYGESNYRMGNIDTTFVDQASNIQLTFSSKIWKTNMIYQKVDPNYHSEGNPYLETDKIGYDFENEFTFSEKYSLTGNYERYNNNVNKSENDTTTVTREQEYKLKYYPDEVSTEFKYKNTTNNGNRPDEKNTNNDTYAITIRDEYSDETWVTYNAQFSKYKDNLLNTNDYIGYSGYVSWNWSIKKDRFILIPYFNYNYFKYKNLGQKQIYYLTNIQSDIVLWRNKWILTPNLEYDFTSQNFIISDKR